MYDKLGWKQKSLVTLLLLHRIFHNNLQRMPQSLRLRFLTSPAYGFFFQIFSLSTNTHTQASSAQASQFPAHRTAESRTRKSSSYLQTTARSIVASSPPSGDRSTTAVTEDHAKSEYRSRSLSYLRTIIGESGQFYRLKNVCYRQL